MKPRPKALYISHGGGPLPLLGDAGHREMIVCLKKIAAEIPRPDALVVVSAHWEAAAPTLTAAEQPELIYDYYGFPPESYGIQYPCPGQPALARAVFYALEQAGVAARLDDSRGLDHGVFVPLKIMYPDADIPCVQLSLINGLDAVAHMEMGAALAGLDWENVLVLGSGFSFHNLRAFFGAQLHEHRQLNTAFEAWLAGVCSATDVAEADRRALLANWFTAPGARYCHPREEHLLPLHVCYGVAQAACSERYELQVMNTQCSMYLW